MLISCAIISHAWSVCYHPAVLIPSLFLDDVKGKVSRVMLFEEGRIWVFISRWDLLCPNKILLWLLSHNFVSFFCTHSPHDFFLKFRRKNLWNFPENRENFINFYFYFPEKKKENKTPLHWINNKTFFFFYLKYRILGYIGQNVYQLFSFFPKENVANPPW